MPAPTSEAPLVYGPPIGAFAAVMGIAGLGLAWRAAAHTLPGAAPIGEALLAAAGLLWVGLACAYAAKAIRYASVVAQEFRQPVASNFFAAPSIGGLLLAAGLVAYTPAALWLWSAAAVWQVGIALVLIGRWISHPTNIEDATPAWFLPIVGNIVAPLAGVQLGLPEVSWFMFSVGLVLWLAVLPLVLHRLILSPARLPDHMTPTLAILVSPPAVGCLSYVALTQQFDGAARFLFFIALFFALLVMRLGNALAKAPFSATWWSITFPSVALAAAAMHYARAVPALGADVLAWALLGMGTAAVAGVGVRSAVRIIRRPSPPLGLTPGSNALARGTVGSGN